MKRVENYGVMRKLRGEAKNRCAGGLLWCAALAVLVLSVVAVKTAYPATSDAVHTNAVDETSTVPGGGTVEGAALPAIPNQANLTLQLDSLKMELARLRDDVERLRAAQPGSASADRDWAGLVAELEMIKAELASQREAGLHRPLMASLDNEGFLLPEEATSGARMTDLENKVKALDDEMQQALNRPVEQPVSNPKVDHGRISVEGFVHQQYRDGGGELSSFDTKRARIGVKGEVNPYTQIKIIGEFAGSTKLLDGVLTYSPRADWSFSAGQYKTPFGSDFLTPITSMPFVVSSMAAGLGPNRDVGITLSYRNKLGRDAQLKTTAGLFNGSGINRSDGNSRKNVVLRSELSLPAGFALAPNVLFGKTNDPADAMKDLRNYGGSVRWQNESFTAMGELVYREIEQEAASAWYVWGGPRINTGWNLIPKVELLARYEQLDDTHGFADDTQSRLTLGTNLYADGKYTMLQINYQIDGEDAPATERERVLVNFQVAF